MLDNLLGRRIRGLRMAAGLTLAALARECRSNTSSMSEYETGRTIPSRVIVHAIDTALHADGELNSIRQGIADVPAVDGGAPVHERIERRRRGLHEAVNVGTVSAAGLDDWDLLVHRHGIATRSRPAVTMLAELDADCAELERALGRPHTSAGLRRLTRVTAQMAGLMFLTLIKLGDPLGARRWASTARIAASEAGDIAVASWVWAQEAYVAYYAGATAEAVAVAQQAQRLAGRTVCVGVPLAAALEARALAMLGLGREARTAIDRAASALHQLASEDRYPSAFGYSEPQLLFHQGNALTHLGDSAGAWEAQAAALDLYPQDDYLDRALIGLDRAACLAASGDADAAITTATTTLHRLTPDQRAGLATIRGREVLTAMAPAARALPAAQDLDDLLT